MSQSITDKDDLNSIMRASPFIELLGMEITEIDIPGETLEMKMPLSNLLSRMTVLRQIHGGAIASLIDTAATFLVMAHKGLGTPTINIRTDYLKPADNTDLLAKARIRRIGRTVAVVDVDVFNDSEALIAIGRGTFGTKTT